MVPHSGVGGCAPRPRKLRPDAVRITNPMSRVTLTMIGDQALGRISRNAMRQGLAPNPRLASTNCCSLSERTCPYTSRVYHGHQANAIAIIAVVSVGFSAAVTASASAIGGTAR